MWLLIHTPTHPTPQVQINGINYDHGLADYLTPGFHYLCDLDPGIYFILFYFFF